VQASGCQVSEDAHYTDIFLYGRPQEFAAQGAAEPLSFVPVIASASDMNFILRNLIKVV